MTNKGGDGPTHARGGWSYSFTSIALSIHITIGFEEDRERAAALIRQAHATCFVCRSLNVDVTIDYTIETSSAPFRRS